MGWGELATREEARNRAMKSWAWTTLTLLCQKPKT